jgi:hypothetical protein
MGFVTWESGPVKGEQIETLGSKYVLYIMYICLHTHTDHNTSKGRSYFPPPNPRCSLKCYFIQQYGLMHRNLLDRHNGLTPLTKLGLVLNVLEQTRKSSHTTLAFKQYRVPRAFCQSVLNVFMAAECHVTVWASGGVWRWRWLHLCVVIQMDVQGVWEQDTETFVCNLFNPIQTKVNFRFI